MTWPVARTLDSHIPIAHQIPGWLPGDGDPWQTLWGFWFVTRSLWEDGRLPLFTTSLSYPLGTDTSYVLLVAAPMLAAWPLIALLGPVAAYNCLIISGLTLAAYGAFLLVRRVTGDLAGSFVGGLLFAFCAYHMVHVLEHLFLILSAIWVPLYVLALLRVVEGGGWRAIILTAALMAINLSFNAHYAVALALFTGLCAIVQLRAQPERDARVRVLRRLLGTGGTALLLCAPFVALVLGRWSRDVMIVTPLSDVNVWSADLVAFFVPSPLHPFWGAAVAPVYARLSGNLFEQTVYLGYVALALAGIGIVARPRQARLWLLSAVVFSVLSLGPLLHVLGHSVFEVDGLSLTVPLPGLLLHFLPLVSGIRVSSRFAIITALALAVLGGLGIATVRERLLTVCSRPTLATGAVALLGTAVLIESLTIPLPVLSADQPSALRALGRAKATGSVLDVPLDRRIAKYQYYQTAHGRPLVAGLLPRPTPSLMTHIEGVPFLDLFYEPRRALEPLPPAWDRRAALRVMDLLDLDTIVIHRDYLQGPVVEPLQAVVTEQFPVERVIDDGHIMAIRLRRDHDSVALWGPDSYRFDFGPAAPRFFLARGWWSPEQIGTTGMAWSMGRESSLGFFLPRPRDLTMILRVMPFVAPSVSGQAITVSVNGHTLGEIALSPGWRAYTVSVPSIVLRSGINVIRFVYRYAMPPARVVQGSADTRELAVAFNTLVLRMD